MPRLDDTHKKLSEARIRDNFTIHCWECEHHHAGGDDCDPIFCMFWECDCKNVPAYRMLLCAMKIIEGSPK